MNMLCSSEIKCPAPDVTYAELSLVTTTLSSPIGHHNSVITNHSALQSNAFNYSDNQSSHPSIIYHHPSHHTISLHSHILANNFTSSSSSSSHPTVEYAQIDFANTNLNINSNTSMNLSKATSLQSTQQANCNVNYILRDSPIADGSECEINCSERYSCVDGEMKTINSSLTTPLSINCVGMNENHNMNGHFSSSSSSAMSGIGVPVVPPNNIPLNQPISQQQKLYSQEVSEKKVLLLLLVKILAFFQLLLRLKINIF
jgi:hypothetical protein